MLADFTLVIGVASVPGTWQNKELPNVFFSHNNQKRDHRKECCTHLLSLAEIYDFVTNEFATSCDYLTFTTTVGYIYNYCLHLKPLATTL